MFIPFLSISNTALPLGGQTDMLYTILPHIAMILGGICVTSYITTRILKRLI